MFGSQTVPIPSMWGFFSSTVRRIPLTASRVSLNFADEFLMLDSMSASVRDVSKPTSKSALIWLAYCLASDATYSSAAFTAS